MWATLMFLISSGDRMPNWISWMILRARPEMRKREVRHVVGCGVKSTRRNGRESRARTWWSGRRVGGVGQRFGRDVLPLRASRKDGEKRVSRSRRKGEEEQNNRRRAFLMSLVPLLMDAGRPPVGAPNLNPGRRPQPSNPVGAVPPPQRRQLFGDVMKTRIVGSILGSRLKWRTGSTVARGLRRVS